MGNSYIDIASIKGSGGLNLGTGTAYDSRLRVLTEAVSREFDRYTNRHFYYTVETKEFDGNGLTELLVPDLIAIGTLKEDTNMDGTFETTWAAADYILYPRNANPTGSVGNFGPYTRVQVNTKSTGTQNSFMKGQDAYQIVGTWGHSRVSHTSGLNGTLADSTATSLVLSAAATGTVEIGHTLLIEDEQVYVTNTTGTSATVTRAVNGTTGTAHANKAVSIIDYPGPVIEAVFIQMARIWRRKDSGFASAVGFPETGQMITWRGGLDSDVKMLLAPFRRLTI